MMHNINIGPTCDTHFNNHPNIQAYMFTLQTCRSRRWRSTKCWLPSPPGLAGWHWLIYIDREGKKVGEMREHGGGRCSRGVVWKVLIHVCSFRAESDPKWRKIPVTLRIWSQTVPWQFLVHMTIWSIWTAYICGVFFSCGHCGCTQIPNMCDLILTHVILGSLPHAHMWHIVTLMVLHKDCTWNLSCIYTVPIQSLHTLVRMPGFCDTL